MRKATRERREHGDQERHEREHEREQAEDEHDSRHRRAELFGELDALERRFVGDREAIRARLRDLEDEVVASAMAASLTRADT